MKKLAKALVVLVLILVILVAVGLFAVDALAKAGLETGGSYALGVETTVEGLDLGLTSGDLAIEGLRIANPEGFSQPLLLEAGKFELALKPRTLLSKTIEMTKFELDGLDVHIEQRAMDNNVAKIMENLEKFESREDKGPGKKVQVGRIMIRNVRAHFYLLGALGQNEPITVRIPQIELEDVASDEAGGLMVAELVGKLVKAVIESVLTQSEGIVPDSFLKDLDANISGLKESVEKEVKGLMDRLGDQLLPGGKSP